MDVTWCTGELKAQIIEEFHKIGCCDLCILRYLGVKEPYIYRDENKISLLLDQKNESNGNATKKAKVSPCTACLGLLQTGLEVDSLDKIVKEIKESNIESLSFCPVLSLPIAFQIRAFSIWNHISQRFPEVYDKVREYRPECIAIKSVWKWVATSYLQDQINPMSEWSNDGTLSVQIFPFYKDEDKECEPLLDFLTQGGKIKPKKGRAPVTKGSADNALTNMSPEEFKKRFPCPPTTPEHVVVFDRIVCSHAAIFVAGRYCKYSRTLSQTPWMIDGTRKTADSVEELIAAQILPMLGADEARFSSSGREDVDVRTLGKGRPFVFEVINPRRTIFTRERMRELQNKINQSTTLISVRDIQIVQKKDLSVLKDGEESKTKNYCALCVAPGRVITSEDCDKLNSVKLPLVLMQNTPVRVMHRRSVACRERSIIEMRAEVVPPTADGNRSLFLLYLKTQAGTYVKEFVHGDLGRTRPNVSELLGFPADILALDVEGVDVDWPPEIEDDVPENNGDTIPPHSVEQMEAS